MMRVLGGCALIVALLTIYGQHISHATFVYEDDRMLAAGGPSAWSAVFTRGRALTNQSWQVIRTPRASHALNLALHVGNVLLAGLLFRQITGLSWIGYGVAGLMALHPLTIESVAYATSRAELIAALGALGSLVAVLARVRWAWLLTVPCLVMAYTGKETGVVAVALIPLVLWGAGRVMQATVACWVMGGALIVTLPIWLPEVPRMITIGFTSRLRVDGLSWLLTQTEAIWRLVVLSVAPFWLSVTPVTSARMAVGLVALILLIGLLEIAWRARQIAPLLTLGIVWCAIVAAPRLFVRTPLSPFNEHQWYLAIPGVACCWMACIEALSARWARETAAWMVPRVPWEPV